MKIKNKAKMRGRERRERMCCCKPKHGVNSCDVIKHSFQINTGRKENESHVPQNLYIRVSRVSRPYIAFQYV